MREAGGTITQLDGSPLAHDGSCLTTCGGAMHDAVLEMAPPGLTSSRRPTSERVW